MGASAEESKEGTSNKPVPLPVDQQDSHKATCSLLYERQGQTRRTPGLAARQLNSSGWLCNRHTLFVVLTAGATRLSSTSVDLHWKLALEIWRSSSYFTNSTAIYCIFSKLIWQDITQNQTINSGTVCSLPKLQDLLKIRPALYFTLQSNCIISAYLWRVSFVFNETKYLGSQVSCFMWQASKHASPFPPRIILNSFLGGQEEGRQNS